MNRRRVIINTNKNLIDVDTEKLNHPNSYKNMGLQEKQTLDEWIKSKFEPSKRIYWQRSSYGLKHDFERDTDIYVTNEEFKGAMLAAGFAPVNEKELNWYFKIKEKDSNLAFQRHKLIKGDRRVSNM